MPNVIVYGFETWDAASGRFIVSAAKAEVSTIERLGAKPNGDDSKAVDETLLDEQGLFYPAED